VTDEITLVLPRERPFHPVAQLVIGGLAVRLDLTIETLEELQLALAGILDRPGDGAEVTLTVRVDAENLAATVGPFDADALRSDPVEGEPGLAPLLEKLVDGYALEERGGQAWVELTKVVQPVQR
jgi:hypothetical protein